MGDFNETFDFVIVGCGGGSMCAGLVMRSAGKSAVILEKSEFAGGTTAKSGGVMWIPNNRFLKRDGIEDSTEKAMTYLDHAVGDRPDAPGATRERRLAYVNKAPEMLDFIIGQGIPFDRVAYWPDYYDDLPGGLKEGRTVVTDYFDTKELGEWQDKLRPGFLPMPATLDEAMQIPRIKTGWGPKGTFAKVAARAVGAKLTGKAYTSAGAALQGRMLQKALGAGVDIRLSSPVTELVVENGRVTGVVTQKNGAPWRVGARLGVLINAGGFARNQEMRDKYQPGTRAEWSNAIESDTGDLIQEMERIGAALAQMEEFVGYQSTIPPGKEDDYIKPGAQGITAKPHAILVDQSGVRYMNEGGSYALYCKNMVERHKTVPAIPSWAILDSQYIARYPLAGPFPSTKGFDQWVESGYLKRADTIAELAGQMGVDPAALTATVERFNGFVAADRDEDFGRGNRAYDNWLGDPTHEPSNTLGSINSPPFYAVPVVPGDVGTYGGVVTDTRARVLREDGAPIEGLYATGVSTASVMGRSYVGAGASIGPSFTWGFVAAQHAANLDNQSV